VIKSKTISLAAVLLLGGAALVVWQWPSRGHQTAPDISNAAPADKEKPQPESDIEIITSGRAGEAHGRAIETADRIARQQGALDDAAASRLLAYISSTKPFSLSDGDWQHLVNSSLNALRTHPAAPVKHRLSETLIQMARSHRDPVLRLYALQHISFWYAQEPDSTKKKQLVTLLVQLSREGDEAGTATMVISDLQRAGKLPTGKQDTAALNRTALRLMSDSNAATDVRISALHTLTDRRVTGILPEVRRIAEDQKELIILRKAAIFAIGRLGNPVDDADRLKSLSKENTRLAQAATPALKHLSK